MKLLIDASFSYTPSTMVLNTGCRRLERGRAMEATAKIAGYSAANPRSGSAKISALFRFYVTGPNVIAC